MYQNLPKARVNNFFGRARLASGRGFTLVEVLVATAIISIVGLALISTISSFLRVSKISQDTIRAQHLASEKIEVLKNMPYDDLSTQNGAILPQGNIPDVETVTSGGHNYVVHTFISFVDDPFDGVVCETGWGTCGGFEDFYPFDYKKATIEVRDSTDSTILAKISTNISANAAETSDDTGILFLQVTDSQGQPVANANVILTNPGVINQINTITDINGLLQIPMLPEDTNNGYHLVVSLPNYSTDQTYPDDQPDYNPVRPDFNILAQQVENITLAIDIVSTVNISVVDEGGSSVSPLDVTITGAKTTHEDPNGVLTPIYKYNQTLPVDASGNIQILNLEWGSYSLTVPSGYFVISTTPYQSVSVPANSTVNIILKVTIDSAWPRIDQVTPIAGVNTGSVSVEILGTNLPVGTTMKLTKSGETDIDATGVISSDGDTKLNGTFDLNGAATGVWNLIVTNGSKSTTQTGGFTISAP